MIFFETVLSSRAKDDLIEKMRTFIGDSSQPQSLVVCTSQYVDNKINQQRVFKKEHIFKRVLKGSLLEKVSWVN